MSQEAATHHRPKPQTNVYSVLVLIAFIALSTAVGFMWVKNVDLTADERGPGFANPFYVIPAK